MSEPERIIDEIYIKGTNTIGISCPKCLERTTTTIEMIQADNRFVCPHCDNVRIVDIEDLLKRRKLIIQTVLNTQKN